jgi:hypothetical protein
MSGGDDGDRFLVGLVVSMLVLAAVFFLIINVCGRG